MITKDTISISHKNFRHLIEFYRNDNSNDLLLEENWVMEFKCFAEALPLGGSNFMSIDNMDFGHITPENLVMFRLRFIKNLSNKLRIRFDNKNFEIKKIIDQTFEGKILQIIAQEVE